jgi:hypothetical protein
MGKRTQLALLTTNGVLAIAPLLVSAIYAFLNATNEQMELRYSPCCDENGFVDVEGDEAGTVERVFGASTRSISRCRAKSSRASSRAWSCS